VRRAILLASVVVLSAPAVRADPADSLAAAEAPAALPRRALPPVDVRVVVAGHGEFVIRPDREGPTNAVAAFLSLAAQGAYDGLAFHRVIPGFLVQTGDPGTRDDDAANDGAAPPWRLPAEPTARSHGRGTVSLAWHDDDPASAGTQWFVALADVPAVDGHATPIGTVVDGMDVVDRIAQVSTFRDRRPIHPVRIEAVRLEAPAGETPTGADSAAVALPDSTVP